MRWLALLPLVALTTHTIVNAALLRRPRTGATTTERVAVLRRLWAAHADDRPMSVRQRG